MRRLGVNFLESDWIATSSSFYYITPRARHLDRYLWTEISQIAIERQRFAKAVVEIQLIGNLATVEMETSGSSADTLVDLWRRMRPESN